MAMLVWVMMGIAVWHFAVFVPDRFYGGIVLAFFVAVAGSALFGLVVNGLSVPGQDDTGLVQALVAVPGAVLAMAALYVAGSRADAAAGIDRAI